MFNFCFLLLLIPLVAYGQAEPRTAVVTFSHLLRSQSLKEAHLLVASAERLRVPAESIDATDLGLRLGGLPS